MKQKKKCCSRWSEATTEKLCVATPELSRVVGQVEHGGNNKQKTGGSRPSSQRVTGNCSREQRSPFF
jgi:hypothetical protein